MVPIPAGVCTLIIPVGFVNDNKKIKFEILNVSNFETSSCDNIIEQINEDYQEIVGQSAWKKIHENGHIDTRTIEALCKYLHCQPGDILEYIPDGTQTEHE